jgi:SpoIID/LytB domain protein
MAAPAVAQEGALNPRLKIGVVQRFGSAPTDTMTLKPATGDTLTLKFATQNQPQTVTTTGEVKVAIEMQPLAQPQTVEHVVLSSHRSFESAEDSANQWRAKGVEVEIAQPREWQVWAKRELYQTSLLRRLLMQNLQANGARLARIDTQVQRQIPKATFIVNGYRYQRDALEVSAGSDRMSVASNRADHGRRVYGGSVQLQPNAYGTYTLVNQVPLETYLRGVVPHEIGLGAPPTTIEAQAILARTYVMRNLRRFEIDNYQLCADTQCQVYWGLDGAAPESDRAIAATQGMVLTYQNELVDALYSSTTGGVTAPFSNVWNGPDRPYLKAVIDSVQGIWDISSQPLQDENNFRSFISQQQGFNEVGWEMFRWREVRRLPELVQDLKTYLSSKQHPLANFGQVQEIKVVERSPAGRVQKLVVTTDRGVINLEKDEIIRALSAPNSLLFYVEPIYETAPSRPANSPAPTAQSPTPQPSTNRVLKGYAFVGGGLGHGVGMSQTGAYRLGELGWSSSRILSFYYPGAQVQPLTDALTFWQEPTSSLPIAN